jgi:hypothetical protein
MNDAELRAHVRAKLEDNPDFLKVQWFEYKSEKTGIERCFSVDHMRFEIMRFQLKPWGIVLSDQFVNGILKHGGVDEEGLARHSDEKLKEPGIVLEWSHGTHVVADGNHRMVKAYRRGWPTFPCFILSKTLWSRCLIDHPIFGTGERVPNVPDICPET